MNPAPAISFQLTTYVKSLLWISAFAMIAFASCFILYEHFNKLVKINTFTLTSIYWGLVIALLMIDTIAYSLLPDQQLPAVLAAIGGAALGWLFGMWMSPLGTNESTKFSRYWTVIGVGSGFSLKWLMDKVIGHKTWIADHWVVVSIGAITCLVTTATVYNSRAYDDSLTIYPRRDPGGPAPSNTSPFSLNVGKSQSFYAHINGPSDPLCRWEVIPASLGVIDDEGLFTAGHLKGTGKLVAFNLEDPTLSNCFEIEVVETAPA